MKEYKVVKYKESFIKAILLGQSKISPERFSKFLNKYADEGWSTVNTDKSIDSILLLFSREIYIIILQRDRHIEEPSIREKSKLEDINIIDE